MSSRSIRNPRAPAKRTNPMHQRTTAGDLKAPYPYCNGAPWTNQASPDATEKIKRQFLDAHFQINLTYARLVEFRKRCGTQVPKAVERRFLQKIEQALVACERLEDKYADRGIFATPIYHNGFVVDLRFGGVASKKVDEPIILSSATIVLNLTPSQRR